MSADSSASPGYFDEASSINFSRSMTYGFGVLGVSLRYFLARTGIMGWALLAIVEVCQNSCLPNPQN